MKINGKKIDLKKPQVMSIINITPDSFFENSRFGFSDEVLKKIDREISLGCNIFDIGAESTRPGSVAIGEEEEIRRLLPVLRLIRNTFPEIIISVDTYRSSTAIAAAECGADIINDISSGIIDKKMIRTVAQLGLPYIAMHMKGNPQNMQQKTNYKNCLLEVNLFFEKKITEFKKTGIKNIIIDPGFGFAKTTEQNFELLNGLDTFKRHRTPILVGLSRKSMIKNILHCTTEEALNGTTALNTIALMKGAHILRVHDVKEAVEVIKLYNQLKVNFNESKV